MSRGTRYAPPHACAHMHLLPERSCTRRYGLRARPRKPCSAPASRRLGLSKGGREWAGGCLCGRQIH
eukprot:4277669-Alexandrium_andersonii.AAC.1